MRPKLYINWRNWETIKPIPYKVNWQEEWGVDVSNKIHVLVDADGCGETLQAALLDLTAMLIERYQTLETCGLQYEDDRQEFELLKTYLRKKADNVA